MRLCVASALLISVSFLISPAVAGGLGNMTAEEKAAFRAEVRAYLIENPEVLTEAADVLQARQDAAAAARDVQLLAENQEAILNDGVSWVGGNLNGDITVVEFMDYRCGYCRKAYQEVEELVKSDGNIRLVLKEYPILGEDSVTSARFAVAVLQLHGGDAYKRAHDALISLRGAPDAATLTRLADSLGLPAQPILDRMMADDVTSVLAANQSLGKVMDISGTPTFVIDQSLLRGYVPLDGMRQIVADERAS